MRWKQIQLLSVILPVFVFMACSPDREEGFKDDYQSTSVAPGVLVSGLNYPWGVEYIRSAGGDLTGDGSVLTAGYILVANRGRAGSFANSVVQVNPYNGEIQEYSSPAKTDLYGEPAVDGPYDLATDDQFVWIANDVGGLGSIAVTDPNPGKPPNGITGSPGEPVEGPLGTGVFGPNDFGFMVLQVIPEPGEENVPQNTRVIVEFSQPVNPDTVTKDTFRVTVDYSPMSPDPDDPEGEFQFSPDYTQVEYVMNGYLAEATRYSILLDKDITDMNGSGLDGDLSSPGEDDFESLFTTGSGNPRVVWVSPHDGASQVPIDTSVEVGFSEPVRDSTVTGSSFLLLDMDGDKIDGTVSLNADLVRARFVPDEPLEMNATYTVQVLSKIEDVSGNPLDQVPGGYPDPFESQFSTGAADNNPPRVSSIDPSNGAQGVSAGSPVTVNFSEAIATSSRIGDYFSVAGPNGNLQGIIEWVTDSEMMFTPSGDMPEDASFTVTIRDILTDLVGNSLDGNNDGVPGGNFVSSFSTGWERLYVTSSYPENGSTGASVSTYIYVNFSKPVSASTVSEASFALYRESAPTQPVPSTVWVNPGNVGATLKPDASLDEDTVYVIVVTTDVTDSAGNPLDQVAGPPLDAFSAVFSTGGEDLTPPCVSSTTPESNASDVPVSTAVEVEFSEAILPATVSNSSFYLTGPGGQIDGVFTFSSGNTRVMLQPLEELESSQTYTVTITTSVTDSSGNGLDGDCDGGTGPGYIFSFTTGVGSLVINEVVLDPQQDWNDTEGGDGVEFNGNPGTGSITTSDEWIEIYNASSQTFDLTNWTVEMIDTTPEVHIIGNSSGTEVFFPATSTVSNFAPGSYLIIGNPIGSNNNDCYFVLKNSASVVVDDLEIGDDPEEDGDGDGAPEEGEDGNADSISNEAIARRPNGFDSDNDQNDFVKQAATIGANNNAAGSGTHSGGYQAEVGLIGMSGITAAGISPDDVNGSSHLFFATHTKREVVYGIDYDDGVYYVFTNDDVPRGCEFVPITDSSGQSQPGSGYLFVMYPEEGNIARLKMVPSGPVGNANTVSVVDAQSQDAVIYITLPYLNDPVGLAYSSVHNRMYVACRGNGWIMEFTVDGNLTEIFDTGLGTGSLGGVDVGDLGSGDVIIFSNTGGERIDVADGPNGSLMYFNPHPNTH